MSLQIVQHGDQAGYFWIVDTAGNRYSLSEPEDGVLRLSSVEPGDARANTLGLLLLPEAQNSITIRPKPRALR